jgi:hypothetical protein
VSAESPDALLAQLETLGRGLRPEARLELLEHLSGAGAVPRAISVDTDRVRAIYDSYTQHHEFRPGQMVEWKPGLRNKRLPDYGQPAVVQDVLAEPVINTADPADSPYFRERLGLILGVLDGDGDLMFLPFDASRFQPVE